MTNKAHNLSPKYTTEKGEDRPGMTMIRRITRLEIDHLVEIGGIAETCTKIIIEMTIDEIIILEEIEVDLEKDIPYETLEGMTEVVVDPHQDHGPDQVQESV